MKVKVKVVKVKMVIGGGCVRGMKKCEGVCVCVCAWKQGVLGEEKEEEGGD